MKTLSQFIKDKQNWQTWHGSVFKVQCYSFYVAKQITGNHSDVLRVDMSEHYHYPPPFNLRLLRPFRTPADQAFRDKVASLARLSRRESS